VKQAPPILGDTSKDKRLTVYTQGGDLYLYENPTGKTRQVTKTSDAEVNPRFLPDGKRISFTRANNLYVLSLEDGSLVQLTDIRAASAAPAAGAPTGFGGGGGGRGLGGFGGRGGGGAPPIDTTMGDPAAARQRQSGISQEGAEGTDREHPRTRVPARRRRGPPQEGEPAQAVHLCRRGKPWLACNSRPTKST
jgi:hypothetical protein